MEFAARCGHFLVGLCIILGTQKMSLMQRAPECTDVPYIGTNYGQLDSCEPAESSTSGPLPRPCQTNQVKLINER